MSRNMIEEKINRNSEDHVLHNEITAHFVKSHLEFVVLSILYDEPMCGKDVTEIIYEKFGILVSPGTMYPLLKKLERHGLVRCERGIKRNTYVISDKAKARWILSKCTEACASIMQFIKIRIGNRN